MVLQVKSKEFPCELAPSRNRKVDDKDLYRDLNEKLDEIMNGKPRKKT